MQLHVDTDLEPIAGLMLLSRLLMDYANMKAANEKAAAASYPELIDPTGKGIAPDQRAIGKLPELGAPYIAQGPHHIGDPCVKCDTPHDEVAPGPCLGESDLTKVFGKFPIPTGTQALANVVPLFPQPALNLPGATGPAVLGAPSATAPVNTADIPTLPVSGAQPAAGAIDVVSAVVDSQGLPWDSRIHSSSKKTKADGTWKLARGLPEGLAQQVTAELLAKKLPQNVAHIAQSVSTAAQIPVPAVNAIGNTPTPPVMSAPNTVPLPQSGGVPVPPFPGTQTVLPGHLPGNLPSAGGVPVAPENPVKRFGAMMAKISAALGEKRITQQQVLDAHKGPGIGLEQLQQAVLHPEKIPLIEAALGLT